MEKDNEKTNRLIKVAIIGPESTGKSTLANDLAIYYDTEWVPEYARVYIKSLARSYQQSDLLEIAKGQIALEDEKSKKADELLICDTELTVIKIWSEYKYGNCNHEILNSIKNRQYDFYLLTNVDIPWKPDPLRENPGKGEYFLELFKKELVATGTPWALISGNRAERKTTAIKEIETNFGLSI